MTAPNLYSVITIMSFIGALPFAALVEGHKVMEVFEEGIAKMGGPKVGGEGVVSFICHEHEIKKIVR